MASPSSSECSGYEESYERVLEEGDIDSGESLVRVDKITVKKKVEEVTRPVKVKLIEDSTRTSFTKTKGILYQETPKKSSSSHSSSYSPRDYLQKTYRTSSREKLDDTFRRSRTPSYERLDRRTLSRTPSEEQVLQDSSYFTQSYPTNGSLSKSSSVASMKMGSEENLRRTPSRERLDWETCSVGSGTGSSKGSEWYQEYRMQSFQNFNSKLERVLTRQEYDSHIAEIRGKLFCSLS